MKDISAMTDREIAEETLAHLRTFMAVAEAFQESPMLRALQEGKNPLVAMMSGM